MAKLSKEDKVKLFDYLELYECEIKLLKVVGKM